MSMSNRHRSKPPCIITSAHPARPFVLSVETRSYVTPSVQAARIQGPAACKRTCPGISHVQGTKHSSTGTIWRSASCQLETNNECPVCPRRIRVSDPSKYWVLAKVRSTQLYINTLGTLTGREPLKAGHPSLRTTHSNQLGNTKAGNHLSNRSPPPKETRSPSPSPCPGSLPPAHVVRRTTS